MSRELSDEEIAEAIERVSEALRGIVDVIEQMSKNIDLLVDVMRKLADIPDPQE